MHTTTLPATAPHDEDRAFAAIVNRHTGLLQTTARRLLGCNADVDDVVQETFLAAWTHSGRPLEGDAIRGWLVTTVRRRCYDRLRSAAYRKRADLEYEPTASDHQGPYAVAQRRALVVDAHRILATLPDLQRRCWELRQIDHLSYAAIGTELGIPSTTVRGMLVRTRALLVGELSGWR
ncbi:sigma-70 family RNA polymerase sigma factor [Agreia sp. PsM10]|uniref:RNA polymerase sigma factor n=1 Tax=Agreia sp. PsM10 TaxID=3030533 RepID=UPI00263B0D69|nr:sigma-70 family RNA polymerase sigma factor [Agreia sp. PsM10]MDN4639156.1 sigma-70 family RNA polymerase sigma factor [Agreia sp. PsM10]